MRQVRAGVPPRRDPGQDLRPGVAGKAPATFKSAAARWKEFKDCKYTLQVAPEDCTGCALCVEICPVKSKSEAKHNAINMAPQMPLREAEAR